MLRFDGGARPGSRLHGRRVLGVTGLRFFIQQRLELGLLVRWNGGAGRARLLQRLVFSRFLGGRRFIPALAGNRPNITY